MVSATSWRCALGHACQQRHAAAGLTPAAANAEPAAWVAGATRSMTCIAMEEGALLTQVSRDLFVSFIVGKPRALQIYLHKVRTRARTSMTSRTGLKVDLRHAQQSMLACSVPAYEHFCALLHPGLADFRQDPGSHTHTCTQPMAPWLCSPDLASPGLCSAPSCSAFRACARRRWPGCGAWRTSC